MTISDIGPGHGIGQGRDVGWSLGGLLHYLTEEPVVHGIIINYYHYILFVQPSSCESTHFRFHKEPRPTIYCRTQCHNVGMYNNNQIIVITIIVVITHF